MTTKAKRIAGISGILIGSAGILYFGSKLSANATIEESHKLLTLIATSAFILGSGVTIFVAQ